MTGRRYYDDLVVGEVRESGEHRVELDELVAFARAYDPQYFHADPDAARGSVFGEVIASGIHTMALWRRLDHQISGDIAWICGVGWEEVKWPQAVRAGDRLRARYECLAKRRSGSDPTRGVVEFRYTLLNQRDETAWTCRSINLIETGPRPAG
ncbi:MAG TPA: MaoC family dehydratase [Steroidobacteraceae bacterium]|nr:MaoC family dehydratase [Steroidobacteraceae bacterium]